MEKVENNQNSLTVRENVTLTPSKVNSFNNFNSVEDMLALGDQLVKSGLTPLKKPADVMGAILMGRELGLGVMTSVNNIHPINGRASSGVHIITALLLKAGTKTEIIEDYVPLYQYKDKGGNVYSETDVKARPDVFQIITSITPVDTIDTSRTPVIRQAKAIDRKTTVKFTRVIRGIDGSFITNEIPVSRTKSDFAHLLEKDNWTNNPKTMLLNRIMAIGGRLIADDVLLGLYLTEELTEEKNMKVEIQQPQTNVTEDSVVEVVEEVKDVKEAKEETVKIS